MLANLQVEQAVLGTLLNDPKASHFVNLINIDDFAEDNHRLIFEAFDLAAKDGRWASPVVLGPQFAGMKLGDITVSQYLGRLITVAEPRHLMPDYIRALKEYTARRVLAGLSQTMGDVAKTEHSQVQPFVEEVARQMDIILSGMRRGRITSFSAEELAARTIARLKAKTPSHLLDTGLDTLNDELGGFGRGELNIIAGRPGMGKTTFALSCMRQAARRGVPSIFFSLEMGGDPLAARILSDTVFNSQTPIPYKKIIRSQVTDWEIARLEDAQEHLASLPARFDEQSGLTVSDIGVRARRYAEELESKGQRLGVIWIDHLGYLQSSDRYRGNKVYEVGEMTKACRRLAKEMDVSVNLLSQLSRKVEEREDRRPDGPDLRDSGNIEEDADSILLLYREAYYLGRVAYHDDQEKELKRQAKLEYLENIVEVISPKTRNGGIFTRRFFTDIGNNVIRDLV